MDETLVNTTTKFIDDYDYKFHQPCCDNEAFLTVFVKLRPFLDVFLEFMSKYYELAIFTAGQQEVASSNKYADYIINFLDKKKLIGQRLYRQDCTRYKNTHIKDLRKFGRELKDIILLDVV